jgi:hypothetical protein
VTLDRLSLAVLELAAAIEALEEWARKGAHHGGRLKDISARGRKARVLIEGETE